MVSSIIVKAISAVYKIPLTAYIGATGRGYFNIAYNLYMPLHAVIMGAFPIALSHLVSKYNEKGNGAKIRSLKKASKRLFFIVGVLGLVIMLAAARPYAQIISSSPKSIYTIYILAPTVLFSSMAACSRSLSEGYMNMVPTSVSQIIEAVFKMVFGLLFAKYSMSYLYGMYIDSSAVLGIVCSSEEEALSVIYPLTSAAAMGGVTAGAFFSYVYASLYTSVKYNSFPVDKNYKTSESMKEILSFSGPIIISAVIQSASAFLDNASVQYCLSLCDAEGLKSVYTECIKISGTADNDIITYIYGLFSSAMDFKNLLPGFTMALGVAAVPAVSASFESADCERLSSLVNSIFKYTSVLSLGGGFYLSLTAPYILNILYSSSNYDIVIGCEKLVYFFGFTMIFYCLSGTAVFAVQAIGYAKKSIPSFIISAVIRVVINYFFVTDYRFNLYGAVISGAAGYFVILVSNLYILKKYTGIKYNFSLLIVRPALCSVFSFFASRIVFFGLFQTENVFITFILFSAVYLTFFTLSLILSKTISFSELKFLQYCKKTA